jgi:two-component system CheB/CheR fusion protein
MPSGNPFFPIVGIGASAGGLEAFTELLRFLPVDTGMAYVFVQHLTPTHESLLTDLLARATQMPVSEVRESMEVCADHVYVIPPNTDMTLQQGVLTLLPRTETRGQHLSIDTFFRSLAESSQRQVIGVILSGTASDGTLGLQAIKAQGGMTFAQEETSAKYFGMPQSAITAGCVDFIGSPEKIARELTRISRHPYVQQSHAVDTDERVAAHEQEFQQILRVLGQRTNVDFTVYKPTTLKRRILRRMVMQQMDSFAQYLAYLRDHQIEVQTLYQDVLIGVTSFFRDPSTFAALAREAFPRLVEAKSTRSPIRVWVPGCSTGEEVYSLAICLLEFLAERSLTIPLQLFGTDLNAQAIEQARAGLYPPSAVGDLSPERLERFFQRVNGNYQIRKAVRDLCVFARHNVLSDPPFSRLDLLSCQNVLIYLKPEVQKKVMQTFHYALIPQGFLLLGLSETIGTASDLFRHLGEYKQQLYVKKSTSARSPFVGPMNRSTRGVHPDPREEGHTMLQEEGVREFDLQKETDRLLASYAPASVVIDAEMEILQFHGHTSPYLEPTTGRASLNLFKMARESLGLALRTAISKARKSGQPVKKEGIQLSDHGVLREVTVEVIPVKASATERYYVILFEDTPTPSTPQASPPAPNQKPAGTARRGAKDRRIRQVEQELAATHEEMRSIIEELEAANEELQSANEEILSSNEEFQSLNEELETSKEEIQASNEELLVINQELQQRQAQLQAARAYAEAIVETIREPLLVLDTEMRVQSVNPAFYQFFQTVPEETENHLLFELDNGQWNIPTLRTLLEKLLPANHSFTDYEVEYTFPRIGRKTMLLNAHRIDHVPLILLAMEDITDRKQAEEHKQKLLEQREEFMAIASHELKTPVTSLKGYTQMLHNRFRKAGDERSAALLAKMDAQLNKLINLIGELLDVTKIEAGKLSWHNERFDLDAFVRDMVEELGHTTERHQIRIEGGVHTPVYGDREHIGRVLTNLLSNAIKYSPQADTILVKLRADADTATIGVQDFGIGIASEKHEHVFERFFRVSDPEHGTFPGLGLGLYISAQIVKRLGGRMWVESRAGVGSTFFFTVPLAPQPAADQAREEGEEQHA